MDIGLDGHRSGWTSVWMDIGLDVLDQPARQATSHTTHKLGMGFHVPFVALVAHEPAAGSITAPSDGRLPPDPGSVSACGRAPAGTNDHNPDTPTTSW